MFLRQLLIRKDLVLFLLMGMLFIASRSDLIYVLFVIVFRLSLSQTHHYFLIHYLPPNINEVLTGVARHMPKVEYELLEVLDHLRSPCFS